MRVEAVTDPGAEWDAFVEATPGAVVGHASAWARILRDAYGLTPLYLAAREADSALAGVLPLVHFRGLQGRRSLVSLPFHDAAGILAGSPAAETALLDAAVEAAARTGVADLELRHRRPLPEGPAGEVDRVDLVLDLEADEEAQWRALPAKVRNQTRKAGRTGLVLAPDTFEGFWTPFCRNMRDLGSPVHSPRFFEAMAGAFGPRLRFVVASDSERSVGGLVAIHYAGAVSVPWASTLRSERARCPNNLIYWEALRWAVEQGAGVFDFGRSPRGGGTHRFKRGWGAREEPLTWLRLAPDRRPLPPDAASDSAVLRAFSRAWTRLPVPLASWLGPVLRRRIAA